VGKRRFPCAVACLLALAGMPAHAQEPSLLTVDQAVLTDNVDSTSEHFLHVISSPMMRRRLSFWIEVRGTPELLEKLKASNGTLTIHHVWRKYVLTGVETRLDQPLQIGRAEDIAMLSEQVATNGYFTWRTWSRKRRLSPGNWRIDLEYDGHTPVMCAGDDGDSHPCFYPFEVK